MKMNLAPNFSPPIDMTQTDRRIAYDLCCGRGGVAAGLKAAGFYVIGFDIEKQPGYAGDEFVQIDVRELFGVVGAPACDLLWGSPPCQGYSIATAGVKRVRSKYPALIEPMREAFLRWGQPYVIENVPLAPLRDPITLCGTMFDLFADDNDGHPLFLRRHRLFESSLPLTQPECRCVEYKRRGWSVGGVYGGGRRDRWEAKNVRHGGYTPSRAIQQQLMGIDWMTEKALHEAIPPAYAKFIGEQAMDALEVAA